MTGRSFFLVGVSSVALPVLVYAWTFYVHFYFRGAYLFDSGLFAAVLWRSGGLLQFPKVIADRSYFCDHFTPFWSLFSGLSEMLAIAPPDYFGLILAASYGILGLYVSLTLRRFYAQSGHWLQDLALSVGFALNGFCLVMADYPHLEVALPAFHLMFYHLFLRRKWSWAALVFLGALSLREDSGFHFTAVMGLLLLWSLRVGRTRVLTLRLLLMSICAFGYSVLALSIARTYFPGRITLANVYFGQPFWGHLSGDLLLSRLGVYLTERAYWAAPLALILFHAFRYRQWPLALGVLAYLPWFLLHWTAFYEIPGSLFGYYGFPFLISMGWVLLAPLWECDTGELSLDAQKRARRLLAGVLILSWMGAWGQAWSVRAGIQASLNKKSWSNGRDCREFFSHYWSKQSEPLVVASDAVIALNPASFDSALRTSAWAAESRPGMVLAWQESDDWEELRYRMRAQGYHLARWRETPILAGVPRAEDLPRDRGWVAVPWLPLMVHPLFAQLESHAWHCPPAATKVALSLRGLNLSKGRYRLELDIYQATGNQNINLALFSHPGCVRLRDYSFNLGEGRRRLELEFDAEAKRYEVILDSPPKYPVKVYDLRVFPKATL